MEESEKKRETPKTTHDVEVPLDAPQLLPLLVEVVERGERDLLGLLGGLFFIGTSGVGGGGERVS